MFFFDFFLVEIWFKNDISIKNMWCLTLNPTSVNNHNAQYAHKHAISTQRGVTTGETQREKNNGENDANCEMSFCEKPPCPKICFAKIWFPQGCVCEILDIQDRGLRKIRVRSFSKDVFIHVLRKTAMPKNMFCENLFSPRMCLRKSWISRTVVCERSGSDLSQKICNC